jgi:hypothetical protein
VPQFPDADWVSLCEARERALTIFADTDSAAVERAILEGIYDGKIKTRGRCQKWFQHPERVPLKSFVWDPELVTVRWDLNCFVRDAEREIRRDPLYRLVGNDVFIFIHIQLRRRDLEKWLGEAAAPKGARSGISPHEVCPGEVGSLEISELAPIEKPAPGKTASYSVVKTAVEKRGRAPEAELLEAVKKELAPLCVSRKQIRDVIAELYGRPGRTGRPKSRQR